MNKFVLRSLFGVAVISASGCSWVGLDDDFRDKGEDYKTATSIEPMVLPDGYDDRQMRELFSVPSVPTQVEFVDSDGDFVVPAPSVLNFDTDVQQVRIQRLGELRWVKVNVPPAEVWPRLRGWLNSQDVVAMVADPELGLIQTDWLVFNDDADNKHRFRIYVESGFHPTVTEIRVEEQYTALDDDTLTINDWAESEGGEERDSWLVDRIANALAAQTDAETVSLLAQNIGGAAKARVMASDNVPHLDLFVSMTRAWATLSGAISNENLTVQSSDRADAEITIDYHPQVEGAAIESGWFNSWFGDPSAVVENATYVLKVTDGEDVVRVTVTKNGQAIDPAIARQVLLSVYDALS